MSRIKVGDHYKITIEGKWQGQYATSTAELAGMVLDGGFDPDETDEVSVEKIEPPVETFKPGDRLRRKAFGGYEITLADEGYLQHLSSGVSFHNYTPSSSPEFFNSEKFERVDLAEVPF